MDALRMAADDDAVIEGWAVPFWGHLAGGKDSYNTFFSARTNYALDWFPTDARPALYQHGLDPDTSITPVGRMRAIEIRETGGENNKGGVWMQAQLDKGNQYFEAIREMVRKGALYLSSGSVEHLVKIDQRSGEVLQWPIIEVSLTPTPANLLATIPVSSFRSALPDALPEGVTEGDTITHTAMRAVWSTAYTDSLPSSSFAYVEPNAGDDPSKRHLPYKDADGKPDAAHVTAALARLDQTDIPDAAKASAKKKLQAAAKKLGIDSGDDAARSATRDAEMGSDDDDVGTDERSFEDICSDLDALLNPLYASAYTQRLDTFPTHVLVKRYEYGGALAGGDDEGCTYWDIPYAIGADQEPVLGTPVQVERNETYTPVARSAQPLSLDAQLMIRHAATFATTTEEYGERRFREGRVLSGANMQTLSDTIDGMQTHVDTLRDLHKRAAARQEEAARAAAFADPETVRMRIKLLELAAAL